MVLTLSRAVLDMMLFMTSCSMHGLCEADGGGRLLLSGTAEGLIQLSVAGIRIGKQAASLARYAWLNGLRWPRDHLYS